MGKDYTNLKLTREQLLAAAGYHHKNAVFGSMNDRSSELKANDDAQARVDR
jgi:hypothetical protein